MNFYIDKPTLIDIPQMRNLIMPEVQKGIILDRTEDEMAGAIRSYSVIRIAESALDSANQNNPSLRADSQNLRGNPPYKFHNIDCHESANADSRNDEILDSSLRKCSAQNDKNSARVVESAPDSANSTQEANSAIADEFLGFCEASDEDRTLVHRGSELKRALRKQLAHTCKSLKSRCESEFSGKIVAFAALQILSLTLAEVRSLIVAPDFRRKGLATLLINHLLKEARALNLKEVLSLTYQREVFEKLGFKEIAKESLPNQKIWADCIKCKKFPVCDEIALLKTL